MIATKRESNQNPPIQVQNSARLVVRVKCLGNFKYNHSTRQEQTALSYFEKHIEVISANLKGVADSTHTWVGDGVTGV